MNKRLLPILRCPVTHKGLSLMRRDVLSALNASIERGERCNRAGEAITQPLAEALITDDGKFGYPIDDGIPVLLETAAIKLEGA